MEEGILTIIKAFDDFIKPMLPQLREEVRWVMQHGSVQDIDRQMDYLLTPAVHGYCTEEFRMLNEHLRTLDEEAASDYDRLFKELSGEE
jgi:hypothetical protein